MLTIFGWLGLDLGKLVHWVLLSILVYESDYSIISNLLQLSFLLLILIIKDDLFSMIAI